MRAAPAGSADHSLKWISAQTAKACTILENQLDSILSCFTIKSQTLKDFARSAFRAKITNKLIQSSALNDAIMHTMFNHTRVVTCACSLIMLFGTNAFGKSTVLKVFVLLHQTMRNNNGQSIYFKIAVLSNLAT